MNDLRPIALTAATTEVCVRLFLKHLKQLVVDSLNPLQFTYTANSSCEDEVLIPLQHLHHHLEHSGSSVRVMFFDFSSALSTTQPRILANNLITMRTPLGFINWILAYLPNRTQFVCLDRNCFSDVITTNIVAP